MLKRKFLAAVLCGTLVLSGAVGVWADPSPYSIETQSISPRMYFISTCGQGLSISNKGVATVSATVSGYGSQTAKTSISASLQQWKNSKWVEVDSWSVTKDRSTCIFTETANVQKGYNYRAVVKCTAYTVDGYSEMRTLVSDTEKY